MPDAQANKARRESSRTALPSCPRPGAEPREHHKRVERQNRSVTPSGQGGELRAQNRKMLDPVPRQGVATLCAWGSLAVPRGRNPREQSAAPDVTFIVHPLDHTALCKRVLPGNSEIRSCCGWKNFSTAGPWGHEAVSLPSPKSPPAAAFTPILTRDSSLTQALLQTWVLPQ